MPYILSTITQFSVAIVRASPSVGVFVLACVSVYVVSTVFLRMCMYFRRTSWGLTNTCVCVSVGVPNRRVHCADVTGIYRASLCGMKTRGRDYVINELNNATVSVAITWSLRCVPLTCFVFFFCCVLCISSHAHESCKQAVLTWSEIPRIARVSYSSYIWNKIQNTHPYIFQTYYVDTQNWSSFPGRLRWYLYPFAKPFNDTVLSTNIITM